MDRAIEFYTKEIGMKLQFSSKIKETGGDPVFSAWLKSNRSSQIHELNWYPNKKWYNSDRFKEKETKEEVEEIS